MSYSHLSWRRAIENIARRLCFTGWKQSHKKQKMEVTKMAVNALEIVKLNDGKYFIDMRLGEFRKADSLERIDFAGRRGIRLCKEFGIFQCPRCDSYNKFTNRDGESKLCPECEKVLWRQDYE